jgi:hypothetical protein
LQIADRLLQVDDVDAVALRKDVRAHLGVPTAAAVAKVHTGFEQLLHADNRHGSSFVFGTRPFIQRRTREPACGPLGTAPPIQRRV